MCSQLKYLAVHDTDNAGKTVHLSTTINAYKTFLRISSRFYFLVVEVVVRVNN
jgi:hypothetical protein